MQHALKLRGQGHLSEVIYCDAGNQNHATKRNFPIATARCRDSMPKRYSRAENRGKMTHFLEIPRSKEPNAVNVAHHVADFPQSARKFRWHWNAWQWTQSIANSSLLSNFLITGNNAGKFSNFSIQLQFFVLHQRGKSMDPSQIPSTREQGIIRSASGILFRPNGKTQRISI
ncbi:MAG TPA: hypothetical protein VET48_08530 [Steroidobacteraceae bacterium]|nr:hypothetical protein [Steroidobacteraceae bacterium]